MPSDVPKEGRCGAKVTSKVGLEIHDTVADCVYVDDNVRETDIPTASEVVGEQDVLSDAVEYDQEMVAVIVSDGEHTQEVDPTWDDVLPLLREEWYVESVLIEEETEDAIEYVEVPVEDDDPYVTNRANDLDGYCLRWPMDNGTCYVHQGSAEEGNTRGVKHGMFMQRSRFMQWLRDEGRTEDIKFIHKIVDSWVEDAPFDRDNFAKVNNLYRLAIDQLRRWYGQDEYVTKGDGPHNEEGEYAGLAYTRIVGTNEDGEEIEVFDENPINLPYSRLSRDMTQELSKMGIYDTPEQEQAEATQSLAQALSGDDE